MSGARLEPLANVTCVALADRGLMIEGPPGSGKSTLALLLIDRGAQLVGDDGVMLERRGGDIWTHPPDAIRGLIEIRGAGIVEFPAVSARLTLILRLDPNASRVPEIEKRSLLDIALPAIAFRTGDAAQALRAEHALRLHGLG